MTVQPSRSESPWILLAIALLIGPFLVFIKHNEALALRLDVLIPLCVLLGIGVIIGVLSRWLLFWLKCLVYSGLVSVFVDFQFDWSITGPLVAFVGAYVLLATLRTNAITILNTVAWALVLSTILIPAPPSAPSHTTLSIPPDAPKPPPLVHIVLDAHLGLAGMHENVDIGSHLATTVQDFYLDRGFRIYPKAYSQYHHTDDSISNLLNYTTSDIEKVYFRDLQEPRVLIDETYFTQLVQRGYRVHVYQTDWLNVCNVTPESIATCQNSYYKKFVELTKTSLATSEKAWVISTLYLQLSGLYRHVRTFYRGIRARHEIAHVLPSWKWDRERVGPISAPGVVERIAEQLARDPRGSAYFVHLILPHDPYVLDENCKVKPVARWKDSGSQGYRDQVFCTMKLIDRLRSALETNDAYDDAILIVHGDHGTRRTSIPLNARNADKLSRSDLINAFSTIWAIKLPNGSGRGLDGRVRSIQRLLPLYERCGFSACDDEEGDEEMTLRFSSGDIGETMKTISRNFFDERG